ncbi:DedA family protein [Novosphingobium sp. JCM 18896]|uniref:DedA family protein n=1 Tax=Novosphingobium sp. JCM 18896 TaxID=2989731 RepID=UPI0022222267|nr:DedA family protein [Novosphingobium sp. JCM 18896]MCW1428428.1 DedA family protein [Novosphingobium sp. JCM 18896]
MTEWILRLIEQGGYWGIAFLMFIENVFPPIPSEVIMGLGGIAVARGSMEFWPLLFIGTVGSTLGNYVWFLVGDRFGYRRLQPLVDRWGRWLTLEWEDIERASRFFRSHGQWVVFAMRFSPFLRTMISLPAGLAHMKHGKFLAFTFVGAAVWNAGLIQGGRWLSRYLAEAEVWLNALIIGSVIVALVAYAWRVVTWKPRS